ncbi:DUF4374 domain-containing protein [Flavobacterium sp. GSB-24]|uniref:DUF4374 domain-containing protein n=1 Tax=Flavobacterium sp. GSB-24 TaxID=2994319 RepID=UPI002490B2AB|nr:DUF4374 domain-containing protein [Flavobacterium sp. GSB-24]BDU26829.1 hypothetical protein FLGSB24_35730 [Flavobacterium sp. GSB-24]
MKKSTKLALLSAVLAFTAFSSCSSDSDKPGDTTGGGTDTGKTKYIITATTGAAGIADYLLTADDVTTGTITTTGNGLEQDGTYRYYITAQNNFFSLLYGQGNPGAVTTYNLNAEGKLVKKSDFQAETVHVFAAVNKDILTIKVPRSGASIASMYKIDAEKSLIIGEAQQDTKKLAGNGERAFFTWATQVGDKVYMPYMSIKGDGVDNFGTVNPDSTWVAVYNYPELKLEKVIKDNRTSYLGAYFTNGLFQDENGDAYGFSGAIATSNAVVTSTKPSAVVKIKKGTTEFDKSYFFNVQEKSGGYKISSTSYISKGKFLLLMYGNVGKNNGAVKMAIADVYNQTFTWVTNAPATLTSVTSRYNITSEDGSSAIVGINTPDGNWIYSINGSTAVATKGMKVEGGQITAIQKLKY